MCTYDLDPVLIVTSHDLAHGSLVEIDVAMFVKCDAWHMNIDSQSVIVVKKALSQAQIHLHNVWARTSKLLDVNIG